MDFEYERNAFDAFDDELDLLDLSLCRQKYIEMQRKTCCDEKLPLFS